jgi:hypothetical protein
MAFPFPAGLQTNITENLAAFGRLLPPVLAEGEQAIRMISFQSGGHL